MAHPDLNVENMFPDDISKRLTHTDGTSTIHDPVQVPHSGNFVDAPEFPAVHQGNVELRNVAGELKTPDDLSSIIETGHSATADAGVTQPIDRNLIKSLDKSREAESALSALVLPSPDKFVPKTPEERRNFLRAKWMMLTGTAAAGALALYAFLGITHFAAGNKESTEPAPANPAATASPFPSKSGSILPTETGGVANGDVTAHAAGQTAETPTTSSPVTVSNAPEGTHTGAAEADSNPAPIGNLDFGNPNIMVYSSPNTIMSLGADGVGIGGIHVVGEKNFNGGTVTLQEEGASVLDQLAALMSVDPDAPKNSGSDTNDFELLVNSFTDNQDVKDKILANNKLMRSSAGHTGQIVLFDTKASPVVFGYNGETDATGIKEVGITSGTLYMQQASADAPKSLGWQDPLLHVVKGASTVKINFSVKPVTGPDGTTQGSVENLDFFSTEHPAGN